MLFAHPAYHKSRVNRVLREAVRDLPRVTTHDLYEAYPHLDIDVRREQELLEGHDAFVFHHPFFWYSTPAILKEWQDLVLEHGWAYGRDGTALRGKTMLSAITTGGREESYGAESLNRYSIRELLAPIEQTARLCGVDVLAPFVVHGTHAMEEREIAAHASDYRRVLAGLRDGRLDLARARVAERLNADLDAIVTEE